jgi:predicted phosphodiesterase
VNAAISRIGLLGDIHAEDASLALALRVLADVGAERIVSVGDIVDGRGSVDRCCALLAEAGAVVVRGNHERWFFAGTMRELPDATIELGAEARAFLAALPVTARIEGARGEILVCHGLGDDDMASVSPEAHPLARWHDPSLGVLFEDERPRWVLNGHTHRRGVWSYATLTIINGGTLFRDHDPCFGLVDLARDEVTYYEIHPGGRIGRTETRPVPPPRGARR